MTSRDETTSTVRLRTSALSCERDQRQLFDGVSFSLAAGSALRVGGPNGAGKTTLLRGLVGLNIYLDGEVHWSMSDPLPYLFLGHRPGISAQLTVLENLNFLARLRGLAPTNRQLMSALSAVSLDRFDDSFGNQLSAGQQRRVMLALLYLPSIPDCWVLDEPFTALDREGVMALEQHLASHCAAGGSVLFSTHHEPTQLPYDTLWLGTSSARNRETVA